MDILPEVTPTKPKYRLFDSGAVGVAAFICCPLGGAILIAVNYSRLEKAGRAVLAIIFGLAATALSIMIKWTWNTPPGSLERLEYDAFSILFLTCAWICTWQAAKQDQSYAVQEHIVRGGQLGSRWEAFWVGAATTAALVVVIGAAVFAYSYRNIVFTGAKDQVIYSGFATKAEAKALGSALKNNEYFLDRGASVLLNKGFRDTTISFVVQDGVWNRVGMLSSFEKLAWDVSPTVGGLPIEVRLLNSEGNVEETSAVGEVRFGGNNRVYYQGSATEADARALGRRFELMGFSRGKGGNVFLIRHDDDGTTLAFVVTGEAWNDPLKVNAFRTIVHYVAPTVGGLPINMQLLNTQLQVEKAEVIN